VATHHLLSGVKSGGHTQNKVHVTAKTDKGVFVWAEELKFNINCSTFVLFDKKFSILD
jgi:hypothetical protein